MSVNEAGRAPSRKSTEKVDVGDDSKGCRLAQPVEAPSAAVSATEQIVALRLQVRKAGQLCDDPGANRGVVGLMARITYLLGGLLSLLLGAIGLFVPLLPTVPFALLAAFCFARSSPRLEQWLVGHERFGPHILAWRSRGAISREGKRAALIAFAVSAAAGFALLAFPWSLVPLAAALLGGGWILGRPSL